MSKPTFSITGTVGYLGASHDYVKYCLSGHADKPVTVRLSSLGGCVNEALLIADEFRRHGKVTVEMVGFNASASTILAMGAAGIKIHEDALYLIHKCSMGVNEWGHMNSEELDRTIADLVKTREMCEQVDTVIVNLYARRCKDKMPMDAIREQMNKATWLSAREVIDLGLADAVFSEDPGESAAMPSNAFLGACGLPPAPSKKETSEKGDEKGLFAQFLKFMNTNGKQTPSTKTTTMNKTKEFSCIGSVIGKEEIEEKDGTVSLSLSEMQSLEDKLKEKDGTIADQERTIRDLKEKPGAETQGGLGKNNGKGDEADKTFDHFSQARELINQV